MSEESLLMEITAGKRELLRLVSSRGLDDPEVMAKSREIDDLVVRYYRLTLRRKAAEKHRASSRG
jgi:hypothetical protein